MKVKKILLSIIFLIAFLTIKNVYARTITPVNSSGDLKMKITETGSLVFNKAPTATSYTLSILIDNIKSGNDITLYSTDATGTIEYNLTVDNLDARKVDSGIYKLKLKAIIGDSTLPVAEDELNYYYDSPYEKLDSPTNLRWEENTARWNSVSNANGYSVTLYNSSNGQVVTSINNVETTSYNFNDFNPQNGWYFKVIATSTFNFRNSSLTESPRYGDVSRTITPVSGNGPLNMKILDTGELVFDNVLGATSYTLKIWYDEYTSSADININPSNTSTTTYNLTEGYLDVRKLDSGIYRLVLSSNNGTNDELFYYYDSPYSKLASPTGLYWDGDTLKWSSVQYAGGYDVFLYSSTTGELITYGSTNGTSYNFSTYSPQKDWFCIITAYASKNYRRSSQTESPRKGDGIHPITFQINVYSYDSTNEKSNVGGQIKVETDHGTDGYQTYGYGKEATKESTVKIYATPNEGYEFVEWRLGSTTGTIFSTIADYTFSANMNCQLYAIFREKSPTPYTISIENYDITLDTKWSGGTISLKTDKGTNGYQESGYAFTSTKGTEVEIDAKPNNGYEFIEWRKDSKTGQTFSKDPHKVFNSDKDLDLYAIFRKVHTITYYSNKGSGTMNPQLVSDNVPTQLSKNLYTRTGYTFEKWTTDIAGNGLSFIDEESVVLTESIELYAQWKKIPTTVSYTTHVESIGWQEYVSNGEMAGTSGRSLRLEAIKIKLVNQGFDGNIEYRTQVQDYGWMDWSSNNEMSGTSKQSKRLEAIEIRLTGEIADHFDIYYRVHAQDVGWMSWASNGERSGTEGYGRRLEGIEIVLVDKGENPPERTDIRTNKKFVKKTVTYRTHVQDYGWQASVADGAMSGTSHESKRLEGIEINLYKPEAGSKIEYRTHVQDYGWQKFVSNGKMSGTSGESKRLEAIEIRLSGPISETHDVYYRVHAENFGWMGWALNGDPAGTAHYSYRLEGIEIVVVEKGEEPPVRTDTRTPEAFKDKNLWI